jgi:hypothetical protein
MVMVILSGMRVLQYHSRACCKQGDQEKTLEITENPFHQESVRQLEKHRIAALHVEGKLLRGGEFFAGEDMFGGAFLGQGDDLAAVA